MKSVFEVSFITAVLALGAGTALAADVMAEINAKSKSGPKVETAETDSISPRRSPAAFAGTMKVESEYIWDGRANHPIMRMKDESTGIACYSFKDQLECAPIAK